MLRTADKRMRLTEPLPLMLGGRAIRRYNGGKPGRLDVATVPPIASPLGWFDASRLTSLTLDANGGRVTAWADLSASGFSAAEETTAEVAASVVIPDRHNGRAVLIGRDQYSFTIAGLSGQDRTQSVFWAGCMFSLASARTMIGATANNGRLFRVETTGRITCTKRNVAALATSSAAMTVAAGTPFAAGMVLDTTTIDLYFNRVTPENFSESTTFSGATGSHIGGGDASVNSRPSGYVCEALFYDGAMSSGNAQLTIDYLMAKWEIT